MLFVAETNGYALSNINAQIRVIDSNGAIVANFEDIYIVDSAGNDTIGFALTTSTTRDGDLYNTGTSGDNAAGNIFLATYNKSNAMQQWYLETDIVQLQKESYYASLNVNYPFINERDNIKITSDYGPRIAPGGSVYHAGLDLSANVGTRINAPFSGVVYAVHNSPDGGGGLYVKIRSNSLKAFNSNDYLCVVVMHLNSISVSESQTVSKGQLIGYSGQSGKGKMDGYSAHLHIGFSNYMGFHLENGKKIYDDNLDEAILCISPLMFYPDIAFTNNENIPIITLR